MQVIKQNGLMIRYFDAIFTQDFEIVMAAVQQDELSLKYAHDTMKKNKEIILEAVKTNGNACGHSLLKGDKTINEISSANNITTKNIQN